MENVIRIHEELGTGKFINVGPLTWFIAVLYLLPDVRSVGREIKALGRRSVRWVRMRLLDEPNRMAGYAEANVSCGDGSNAYLWQRLWCTTTQWQIAWNDRYSEQLLAERRIKKVVLFR
ncbi:MAG: hypothetical protein ABH846_01125 [Patescibacteria group bacterium]